MTLIRMEWSWIITISSHASITYWLQPQRSGTGEEIFRWQTIVHCKKIIFKYYFGNYCENYKTHKHLRIRVPKTPCFLLRHLATDNVTATRVLQSPTRNSCGCCDLAFAKESKVHYLFLGKAALRWMWFNGFLPSCLPLCRLISMRGLTPLSLEFQSVFCFLTLCVTLAKKCFRT